MRLTAVMTHPVQYFAPWFRHIAAHEPAIDLTVIYGTESGNTEKLADLSAKVAKKKGFQAAVKNMSDLVPTDLAKFENLLVIVSTWGDGEPPESAITFYKEFMNGAISSHHDNAIEAPDIVFHGSIRGIQRIFCDINVQVNTSLFEHGSHNSLQHLRTVVCPRLWIEYKQSLARAHR